MGPCSRVCACWTLSLAQHQDEWRFFGANVCRVTFKHLPQLLRTHTQHFWTLRQLLEFKIKTKTPPQGAKESTLIISGILGTSEVCATSGANLGRPLFLPGLQSNRNNTIPIPKNWGPHPNIFKNGLKQTHYYQSHCQNSGDQVNQHFLSGHQRPRPSAFTWSCRMSLKFGSSLFLRSLFVHMPAMIIILG